MPPSTSSSSNLQRRNRQLVPGRMGMRKWLEHLLDNNQCWGLQWEDKSQKIFSIVWKHASSHGFDRTKHAEVYMKWAIYKGRTAVKRVIGKRKIKSDDYDSKHKSNFRCALHSLVDCIDISGDEDSSKKFFQFIDSSDPQYKVRRDRKRERNSYNKKGKKRTHDGKFSEGQNNTLKTEVKQDEMKDSRQSNEDESMIPQKTEFGEAITEDQKPLDYIDQKPVDFLAGNPDNLPAQSLPTLPHPPYTHEMETLGLPSITLLRKEKQVEIIYGETSQGSTSSLPNFEALGVKDQYGPKTFVTSTQLGNGGEMSVKKEAEVTPVIAEPIIVVSQQPDVNAEHVALTNEVPVQEIIDFLNENSSQETGNVMFISQDQAPYNNPFLPYTEDSGVITRSTNILNNEETQFTNFDDLDFTETEQPFCDSF